MSERWKYQLKTGGIWGVFMVIVITVFDLKDKPLIEQLSSWNFYVRSIIYIGIGIFVLGYFNWKAKEKRDCLK
jgi:putative Mn2+ efflux pump MntP